MPLPIYWLENIKEYFYSFLLRCWRWNTWFKWRKNDCFFLKKVGIHSMQAEQSVRGIELKEKEEKD